MADTVRTIAALQAILADGQAPGSITPQDIRDLLVSLEPLNDAVSYSRLTGTPTTIGGLGVTADFNTQGDARWLPKTGGVLTGRLTTISEQIVHQHLTGTSGTVNIDLAVANSFDVTVAGAMTLTIANPGGAGFGLGFLLVIINGGSAVITYPAECKFPGAIKPVLTASGTDIIAFYSYDGGATYKFMGAQLDDR